MSLLYDKGGRILDMYYNGIQLSARRAPMFRMLFPYRFWLSGNIAPAFYPTFTDPKPDYSELAPFHAPDSSASL